MSDATPPERKKVRVWWPVLAFLLVLAYANVPPFRTQALEQKKVGLFMWHWRLYEHGGRTVCDVRYFDMNKGGEPIERWKLLGYDRPGLMPDELARTHIKELRRDYTRVCRAMREHGDPEPNVEVFARCGVKAGWAPYAKRKSNACAPKSKKPKSDGKSDESESNKKGAKP